MDFMVTQRVLPGEYGEDGERQGKRNFIVSQLHTENYELYSKEHVRGRVGRRRMTPLAAQEDLDRHGKVSSLTRCDVHFYLLAQGQGCQE
jgi:hypothetical protein